MFAVETLFASYLTLIKSLVGDFIENLLASIFFVLYFLKLVLSFLSIFKLVLLVLRNQGESLSPLSTLRIGHFQLVLILRYLKLEFGITMWL